MRTLGSLAVIGEVVPGRCPSVCLSSFCVRIIGGILKLVDSLHLSNIIFMILIVVIKVKKTTFHPFFGRGDFQSAQVGIFCSSDLM